MSEQNSELGRLTRLGFKSRADCLLAIPKEYRDCTKEIQVISSNMVDSVGYFSLKLSSLKKFDKYKNQTNNWKDVIRVQVNALDRANNSIGITIFGAVCPWLKLSPGSELKLYGELSSWNGSLQLNNPILVDPDQQGKITPVYRGKVGQVSAELVEDGVKKAMHLTDESSCQMLATLGLRETEFTKLTGISSGSDLLNMIHKPNTIENGKKAIDVAKKLCALAIVKNAQNNQIRNHVAKSSMHINRDAIKELIARLPYPLTCDQTSAVNDVVDDLRGPYPMNRLLSGDVGTGKSLVFMIPAVAAYKSGYSVGIVVPSQLLASQIATEIQGFFPEVEVCKVVAGSKFEPKGIIVGTTALLNAAAKKKHEFDFVVTDEQHKFSVGQKTALIHSHTNFLEATATVIPRTLAIVNYGGMDLSVLQESPVNKIITSRVVDATQLDRLYDFVGKVFDRQEQVAIILPLVSEQDDSVIDKRLQSVSGAYQQWKDQFPQHRVAILTGKMSAQDKDDIISKMHSKEIDLLISTVVIETGVTLPSLRSLIVVHPERFGASQLHQLRGRVARKGGRGYFMMYCPHDIEPSSQERLDLLMKHSKGFDIAQEDMNLRGFGDIEGEDDSQTGTTKLLFWGARIFRKDIEEAAQGVNLFEIQTASNQLKSAALTPTTKKISSKSSRDLLSV